MVVRRRLSKSRGASTWHRHCFNRNFRNCPKLGRRLGVAPSRFGARAQGATVAAVCDRRRRLSSKARSFRLRALKVRFFFTAWLCALLLAAHGQAQETQLPAADSSSLDFKQFGLLGIQDGGRRKPVDTFAREALIKLTGRSTYKSDAKTWQGNDFILSMLLDTHKWQEEPMILVSLGQLIEQLGLDQTQRRFSFTQLSALPELNRLVGEAHKLKQAEKPLSRLQNEAMAVGERLTLFSRIMDGSAFLLVPASQKETDPWVVPPGFAQYYSEAQFGPAQTQLQKMARRLHAGRFVCLQSRG